MKLSTLLIVMILVGVVIVSMYAFVIDLSSENNMNVNINTSYSVTYDKVSNIMNHTNETYSAVTSMSSEKQQQFFTGAWDVITISISLVVDSIVLPYQLLNDFSRDMGLPPIVQAALVTIIFILALSALIFLVTKRKW